MKWSWPWRRNEPAEAPFRELGWDVHSHLVPGVDDGAQDLEASLDMVRGMAALGYRGMVLTPHIMADLYPNSHATLKPAFETLVHAVQDASIPIELQLAAEYLLDVDCLKQVQENDVMTFHCTDDKGLTRQVLLLEFGFHHAPDTALVKELLFEAQTQGLTPLLAHCERYPYLHRTKPARDVAPKRRMDVGQRRLLGRGVWSRDQTHGPSLHGARLGVFPLLRRPRHATRSSARIARQVQNSAPLDVTGAQPPRRPRPLRTAQPTGAKWTVSPSRSSAK